MIDDELIKLITKYDFYCSNCFYKTITKDPVKIKCELHKCEFIITSWCDWYEKGDG